VQGGLRVCTAVSDAIPACPKPGACLCAARRHAADSELNEKMAVLENLPSKTLGFLHVFSSENHFFNTLLRMASGSTASW